MLEVNSLVLLLNMSENCSALCNDSLIFSYSLSISSLKLSMGSLFFSSTTGASAFP